MFEEEEEEKNLVFSIPFHQLPQTENVEKEKEKEKDYHYQHSTSPLLEQAEEEEQKKTNDNDNDDSRERALLLQSISSLLHFVNANGSNVGTLELIQGRRLKLSLTAVTLRFRNNNNNLFNLMKMIPKYFIKDLDLDIEACAQYLIDHIFDNIQFDKDNSTDPYFITIIKC